jgi:two-component system, NtrC family, C4-dicarboxylate transport response regulator DctD
MTARQSVALVEDDADLRLSIAQMLQLEGYEVLAFANAEAALEAIDAGFDGPVVTDVRMSGMGGIGLFHRLLEHDRELPVLLMSGHADVGMAVGALKAGAWDFLIKPFEPEVLSAAVSRAASKRALTLENRRLSALAEEAASASPFVGRSIAITRLREMGEVLAEADLDVLIEGETGTGKELFARVMHNSGRRRRGRFVVIACAAVPDLLVQTDLFAPHGSIAGAQGGTLFLDDVDQASPALQARLAQLAETRLLVGGREPMPLDCRIIAAIGKREADSPGQISRALYYRLAGMRLQIPPLRERVEDVPLLFAHFLSEAAIRLRRPVPEIDATVRRRLLTETWPGNVRELASFADQVVLGLVDGKAIAEPASAALSLPDRVAAFEREAITDAIKQAKGDIGQAIDALGLPRKTFYYKVKRHGIALAELRRAPPAAAAPD